MYTNEKTPIPHAGYGYFYVAGKSLFIWVEDLIWEEMNIRRTIACSWLDKNEILGDTEIILT